MVFEVEHPLKSLKRFAGALSQSAHRASAPPKGMPSPAAEKGKTKMPVVPCGARGKTVGVTRSVVGRRLPTVRVSVRRQSFALLGTADHVHGDAVMATHRRGKS